MIKDQNLPDIAQDAPIMLAVRNLQMTVYFQYIERGTPPLKIPITYRDSIGFMPLLKADFEIHQARRSMILIGGGGRPVAKSGQDNFILLCESLQNLGSEILNARPDSAIPACMYVVKKTLFDFTPNSLMFIE